MSKLLLIAIIGICIQACVGLDPDCSVNDPLDLTFYPMPRCNKFYQCVNGEQLIFTCPEDLVFNFQAQTCDYQQNVDCENQIAPTDGPIITEEPVTNHPQCGPEVDLTFFPMPKCNQFFQCVDGQQHVFTCQQGLVFNFQEQVCDYPANVDCDNQVSPTQGPTGTEEPVTNHPQCGPEVDLTFFPMPECNKFFQCIGGQQHVFTCQQGLVFNFQEQVCDYPANVDCDNQVAPTQGPTGTEEPVTNHPQCGPEVDLTFFPMPECNKFFQCIGGQQHVLTCQVGLVFNFQEQVCDYPENVDCDNQVAPTQGPSSTDNPVTVHPQCGPGFDLSFYPMPECNQFFQCIGGLQQIFTCQEGLVFNFYEQVCDYPENVDCDNQVAPS